MAAWFAKINISRAWVFSTREDFGFRFRLCLTNLNTQEISHSGQPLRRRYAFGITESTDEG